MRGGAGELKHRRDHIDDMSGIVPGFATGFDAFRPGNDERGRRAAFVGPGLVASERSVAGSGPTGAKTKVGRRGSQGSFRIVSSARTMISALAPLSERNMTMVLSHSPMDLI